MELNPRKAPRAQDTGDKIYEWLNAPIHASTLGLFRFVYGLVMMAQILKWWNVFDDFKGSIYMVPYAGVGFVKPVDPDTGDLILHVCMVSSFMLAIGLFTRVAGPVTFITFAYIFHLCESLHNNHFILMCHVNFVGSFLDWGQWCSVDSWLRRKRLKRTTPRIPYWNLLLMQFLFTIPYFYGSIAKMNKDWLFRAQPVTMWFSKHDEWIFHQWWFPWAICWGGMAYDAIISFLLFWKKTRFILGFPGAIFFNLSNKLIFNIGVFPYAMICSLVLFLDPHTPAAIWNALNGLPPPILPRAYSPKCEKKDADDMGTDGCKKTCARSRVHKYFVLIFVGGFVVFHALFPLRHFVLYKSNPSWTEEGHIGAWHMKLRSKHGFVYLRATGKDGTVVNLIPEFDPYVTRKQMSKIETRPHPMMIYIARLNLVFNEANQPLKSLTIESCFSLNTNPAKKLYIPSANMLEYIGKYEVMGTTGIGEFIYTSEDAPYCDRNADPSRKPDMPKLARETYLELYKNANFSSDRVPDLFQRWRRRVTHESPEGVVEYGYMWKRWEY